MSVGLLRSLDVPEPTRILIAYILGLGLLWVSSAMPAFWLMVVVVALPAAIPATPPSPNRRST